MDPLSITLGVLPLIGGAISTYKFIHKKLKFFCHYSREVRRIQKHFDRQSHFFTNEVHLLLRHALGDEGIVRLMLKDARHPKWNSPELEAGLHKVMDQSYEVCRDVIKELDDTMQSLQSELCCFDILLAECRRDEVVKDAIRRLRDRVKIAWNKPKLEELIKDLRISNDDLRRLRQQAYDLLQPDSGVAATQRPQKTLAIEFGQFGTVRRASKALYEALAAAWSNPRELGSTRVSRHTVRLFLDTQVKEDVYMELVISCFGHGISNTTQTHERLAKLQVRSQLRTWTRSSLDGSPSAESPEDHSDHRSKRRRVRFQDEDPSNFADRERSQVSAQSLDSKAVDLCSKDLCSALHVSRHHSVSACLDRSTACLGYVDTSSQENFRHSFYRTAQERDAQSALASHCLTSIKELLDQPAEASLSIVEQLKLARDLASAVLKFHSTPWLREYFSLCDLSFFRIGQDVSRCLQTLHFDLEFVQLAPDHHAVSSMEDVTPSSTDSHGSGPREVSEAVEHARLQFGIRNLTLWSLGTALLQIGRWSAAEAPDDVASVRRMSSQVSSLGPRYRDLTKKCLDCDFGYGDDLSRPLLQQSVCENLVCELNDMVASLDIAGEDE